MTLSDQDDLQRAIHERVELQEYDPIWPSRFAAERDRLRAVCGERLLGIEHVGSTAVPGLSAKPIIDIIATVPSIQEANEILALLCANGYTTSAEFNAYLGDKRWLMRQESGKRTHHLHLVLPTSDEWSNKIRFRDILRKDSGVRERYVALKQQLAKELGKDREAYTDAKTEFVRLALNAG